MPDHAADSGGHRPAPVHTDPAEVSLLSALSALADPVRLQLVRELAGSAEWTRSCGSFDVPVGKAALSHHFTVLRASGLVEQRDHGPKRLNRLRREEFDARFPGLLDLVLRADGNRLDAPAPAGTGSAQLSGERGIQGVSVRRRDAAKTHRAP